MAGEDVNEANYVINGDLKLSVPKLMILGILFSASNARSRAERFYELIQLDLEPSISIKDEEFKDLFPLIGEISYNFIIKHYNDSFQTLNAKNEYYSKLYPQLKGLKWQKIERDTIDMIDLSPVREFIHV